MDMETVLREKHSNDKEQLEFVFSDDEKIIVTAPAGCGKTTAMVSKIARELCIGSVKGRHKILAMTFSVNAAMKIKDSLKELLPGIGCDVRGVLSRIDIANYHNFALRLLFKYGFVLNDDFVNLADFSYVDDQTIINRKLLSDKEEHDFMRLGNALLRYDYDELIECIDIYWHSLEKLIKLNIITYNGILVSVIKLLSYKNVSKFYQKYYQMIIIDEFQDTNLLGYILIDKLVDENKVVFLGDDIQKIYGFIGAVDGILGKASERYNAKRITFKTNYRFRENERMRKVDSLIRHYAEKYAPSSLNAEILVKQLDSDNQEVCFIAEGIKQIANTNGNVAILVRSGWQGGIIVSKLEEKGIPFFNALFAETDKEYINFYKIASEEYHKHVSGKAVHRSLQKCLEEIKNRETDVYDDAKKKYVFDSLYKLLVKLFEVSKTWDGTSKDKYVNIDFYLSNKGLKHMMEYLEEKVILTTIHSSKGLEWDYVIIPQMTAGVFPSNKYMCANCREIQGCSESLISCSCKFNPEMSKLFKEEISAFYVALTRAKKDVFITVNNGPSKWKYLKKTSCFINLPGLKKQDYEWENVIY